MSNSQFIAVVGAVILLLIGILLFERYADCQEKGGSFVMVYGDGIVAPRPRFLLECQIEQSPSHRPKAKP
jgi:hypothetical protein